MCSRCYMRSRRTQHRQPPDGTRVIQRGALDWQDKASCRDSGRELFFDPRRQAEALNVCRYCPVTIECLALADATEVANFPGRVHGIYGGETPRQRIARRKPGAGSGGVQVKRGSLPSG